MTVATVLLALTRHSPVAVALWALLLGLGAGAGLQASSATATEGVGADVAGVSTAVNSTVRRLAGGIGGQVGTILLASLAAGSAAPPFMAYSLAYGAAAIWCALGATLLVWARRSPRAPTV